MKWMFKVAAQKVLGLMPPLVADPLYHGLQQGFRDIPIEIDGQRSFMREAASSLQEIRGKPLTGMRIVEVGSGWYPVLPLLLTRELGAATVFTFDVNHHYSPARIAKTARDLMGRVEQLRGDSVLELTARTGKLPECIRYYPRTKIQDVSEIPGGPADLALSRSVLEYASPEEILAIHNASMRWLTPDALWFHLVGTSDDRARQDKTLNKYDFLRYSDKTWMYICNNRYGYKNRLRLPQYRSLFQSAGWRVAGEKAIISAPAIAAVNQVPLHGEFAEFTPEDLVAGAIRFALVRA